MCASGLRIGRRPEALACRGLPGDVVGLALGEAEAVDPSGGDVDAVAVAVGDRQEGAAAGSMVGVEDPQAVPSLCSVD
jgi:hypothetical protein